MNDEWKEYKLKDITSLITKGTTPSMIGANFTSQGIKFIKSECILENSRLLDSSKYTFISSETNERLKRSKIIENDILFSMAGMFLGKTGIATKDDVPANTNQAVAIIRIIPEKADFKYVYYFLNQKALITYINGISGQSAQPNINLQQIGDINITLPPLPTQQKIAAILSSLDDKIELNNRINDNLEQQAQAIFKNWFVDFEPFGGKMPEEWRVGKLGEISMLSAGGDKPQEVSDKLTDEFSIPIYSNGLDNFGLYGYTKKAKIFDESVTVSARGTIGYVCLRVVPYVPIVRLISLIPKKDFISAKYLYLYLLNCNIAGTGTTQQQLTVPAFSKESIIIPSKDIIDNFTNIVNPFFDTIFHNRKENERLSCIRNTLLPKLMSGEIEVEI